MAGKRKSNREGSIWQRQDGRWTGAAYVLTAEGIFRRVYIYGRTREETHNKLIQLQERSARGLPHPAVPGKWGSTSTTGWLTWPSLRCGRLPMQSMR